MSLGRGLGMQAGSAGRPVASVWAGLSQTVSPAQELALTHYVGRTHRALLITGPRWSEGLTRGRLISEPSCFRL